MVICYYPQQSFHHAYSTQITSTPVSPLFDFDVHDEVLTCYPGPLRHDELFTPSPIMHSMRNPLLAGDHNPSSSSTQSTPSRDRRPTFSSANFLKLQTTAAVARPTMRRNSQPLQDLLETSSNEGRPRTASAGMSRMSSMSISGAETPSPGGSTDFSDESPSPGLAGARCSRCKRTPSVDHSTMPKKMVQYGLNQFYCSQCAQMVGLAPRTGTS